jgi:AP-1-like factor
MANGVDIYTSPIQQTPGSGQLSNFDESPSFLDYDLDDGNFDWDNSGDQLFGDLPGTEYNEDGEHHDKRKAASGEDDEEEGSSKRREGNDKGAKKPGRKPLTGEPTTVSRAYPTVSPRRY